MAERHSLLARQLKKYSKGNEPISAEWQYFIDAVNDAYISFDNDRKMLEHSLDLSSQELIQFNQELKANENKLRDMVADLQKANHEIKQTHAQLLQSGKMASIGQLAAGVAHEINNPLGFINSNFQTFEQYWAQCSQLLSLGEKLKASLAVQDMEKANILLKEYDQRERETNFSFMMSDVVNLIKESKEGLERIRKIVSDLRIFARVDADAMQSIKIEEVVDSILSIVDNELKYKAVLRKNYGDTPVLFCNAQTLGQVFINLLINAAQAIQENGFVDVRTYVQNSYVCVDISDTGCGIEEINLMKISDPFFTTKPVGQGTGLGLSVSYNIIKKHGGDIKVKSQVGKGSVFTVMLPISNSKDEGSNL